MNRKAIALSFVVLLIAANTCIAAETSVVFTNPYFDGGRHGQKEEIVIPNGSCLLVARESHNPNLVRAGSAFNDIPNPLGINHTAIVINDYPETLSELLPGAIEFTESLSELPRGKLTPFSIEAQDVIRLIPLAQKLIDSPGNYYLRPLKRKVSLKESRKFIKEIIGRPYASYGELLRATREANKEEDLSKLFCSELSSLFYKREGFIDIGINVSNVLPEQMSSGAGQGDILRYIAEPEITLRWERDFSDETDGPV